MQPSLPALAPTLLGVGKTGEKCSRPNLLSIERPRNLNSQRGRFLYLSFCSCQLLFYEHFLLVLLEVYAALHLLHHHTSVAPFCYYIHSLRSPETTQQDSSSKLAMFNLDIYLLYFVLTELCASISRRPLARKQRAPLKSVHTHSLSGQLWETQQLSLRVRGECEKQQGIYGARE